MPAQRGGARRPRHLRTSCRDAWFHVVRRNRNLDAAAFRFVQGLAQAVLDASLPSISLEDRVAGINSLLSKVPFAEPDDLALHFLARRPAGAPVAPVATRSAAQRVSPFSSVAAEEITDLPAGGHHHLQRGQGGRGCQVRKRTPRSSARSCSAPSVPPPRQKTFTALPASADRLSERQKSSWEQNLPHG